MKSKTVVIAGVAVVVLVLIGAAALFVMPSGPRLEDVKHLLEPRIVTLPSQRVLVVEAKGDPTVMGSEAFGLLFKTYYRLKGVPKGPRQPAPRARWPLSLDTRKEQWIGRYAMPVPDSVGSLPEQAASASGLRRPGDVGVRPGRGDPARRPVQRGGADDSKAAAVRQGQRIRDDGRA